MRYWRVNQNQTFRQEQAGGYLAVLVVVLAVLVAECRKEAPSAPSAPPTPEQLVGRWQLVDANGRTLGDLGLSKHVLTFGADSTLAFESALGGDGTQVAGAGTWRLQGGTLSWVVGESRGSATAASQGGDLHLSADPVLRQVKDGATYRRSPVEAGRAEPTSPAAAQYVADGQAGTSR